MDFQLLLNVSDRGWLETTYYQLGSDYRGNLTYLLSYMSQMGGWSILDYALHFAADPTDYLRLGYASSLSSWALVNSGTEESGYGYWFPGKANDGAAGGGFMPDPIGRAWIGKEMTRGAWYYSAEEDVGYAGALRSNATIVADDPVFGELAYGGVLSRSGNSVRVLARDGLRARFHVIRGASDCTWCWITTATPTTSPSSSRTICRESSSSWRTAPAAPTRRRWRWPVCPPEPTTSSSTIGRRGTVNGGASSMVKLPVGAGRTTKVAMRRAVP